MAEMITTVPTGKNARATRFQIPRIDLTPMVDLGFLLLTFFVFSSTLSTPTILKTIYPDDRTSATGTDVKASGALTLLLGNNDQVYYYEGLEDPSGTKWKQSNIKEIRAVIVSKKLHTPKDDFVVLIKPGNNSNYNNLVSMIDEMKISTIERYSIVEPATEEQNILKQKGLKEIFVK